MATVHQRLTDTTRHYRVLDIKRLFHPPPPRRPLPYRLGHAQHRAHPRRRRSARHPSALVRPRPANRRPRPYRRARTPQALAREHRATDRLHHAAPSAKALFVAAAERNHHLGVLARGLIELLNAHGPVALERAIAAALQSDAAYLGGVRHRASSRSERHHRPAAQGIQQAATATACSARRPAAAHPARAPPRPRRLRPPPRRIRLRRRGAIP